MKLRKTDGFSVLEVMIGVVIFTTGLLLLTSMMIVSLQGNKWSDKTTQSVQLIRDKIEQMRNVSSPVLLQAGNDEIVGVSRSWSFNDLATPNVKEMTVVVTWLDERERIQACTTVTYLQTGS